MTKNQIITRKRIITILLILTILVGVLFCAFYVMVQSSIEQAVRYPLKSSYEETGKYQIDPETILKFLDQGKTDIFKPLVVISESDTTYTPSPVGLYSWHQSDYLKIASALHQFVWNDNLENWHLYRMSFSRGCQDDPAGFNSGEITYFKAIHGPFNYTTHVMDIYPVGGGVSWGGGANFPRPLSGWKSIDVKKLEVNADEVLQMAEENGGRDARLKVENVCEIDVILSPNTDSGNVWRVTYFSDLLPTGNSIIFKMHADPYTGEYKILNANR